MPKIEFAIVDSNILSCLGLQRLLENIIPVAEITVYNSFEELVINQPERFMHFFVASAIYFEHAQYFIAQQHRSIVMVHGETYPHLTRLLTLNVCQDEKSMAKSLLKLRQIGHSSERMAEQERDSWKEEAPECPLSSREIEVAILLAKGMINKEIADKLCISLATVITHRKNIMNKLKARSLADIIVHVVMSGLIGIDEL